jgi:hypothetical protein
VTVFYEPIPTPDESEVLAQRRRLGHLVAACVVALALLALARSDLADTTIAGAATGDGCGGWRGQVEQAFGPHATPKACSVLLCESSGDTGARSRTNDHGLLQINAPTWNRPGHSDPVAHFIGVHWDRVYDGWSNLVMGPEDRSPLRLGALDMPVIVAAAITCVVFVGLVALIDWLDRRAKR